MTINSSLGFMEISGNQKIDENMDMDYIIGVPWKMIGQIASRKLFKRRNNDDAENDQEIQYKQKKSKFVSVKIVGDLTDFKVSLVKNRK